MSTPSLKKMFEIISESAKEKNKLWDLRTKLENDRFDKKMMKINFEDWSKDREFLEHKKRIVTSVYLDVWHDPSREVDHFLEGRYTDNLVVCKALRDEFNTLPGFQARCVNHGDNIVMLGVITPYTESSKK